MEFREFENYEGKDIDIKMGYELDQIREKENQYQMEIIELVGFLEDDDFEYYGLTEDEYYHPTKETVEKVRMVIETEENKSTLGR